MRPTTLSVSDLKPQKVTPSVDEQRCQRPTGAHPKLNPIKSEQMFLMHTVETLSLAHP